MTFFQNLLQNILYIIETKISRHKKNIFRPYKILFARKFATCENRFEDVLMERKCMWGPSEIYIGTHTVSFINR